MRVSSAIFALACSAAVTLAAPASKAKDQLVKWPTLDGKPPRLIGHRGERAFSIPEHSIPAYHMGIWEHADYVEPDLVLTKDGQLVIYHDLFIKAGTDVADHPEFADRMRPLTIVPDPDGNAGNLTIRNDWFIADFTLAELKTLKLRTMGGGPANKNMRNRYFDNLFELPTFQEYLDLVHNDSAKIGRKVGVIPELKHPEWHNALYPDQPHYFENKVIDALVANGYPARGKGEDCYTANAERGPVYLQSFERGAAEYIHSKTDYCIVQLIYGNIDLLTPKGLDEVAKYATAISPWKESYTVGNEAIFQYELGISIDAALQKRIDENGGLIPPHKLNKAIKKRGLQQTPYTFYSSFENGWLWCNRAEGCPDVQDRRKELYYFFSLGHEGLFVENVAEAVSIRQQFAGYLNPEANAGPSIVNYTRSDLRRREDVDDEEESPEVEALRLELVKTYLERAGKPMA
jgi:glycerophosphoryl diester phosphodiesterase